MNAVMKTFTDYHMILSRSSSLRRTLSGSVDGGWSCSGAASGAATVSVSGTRTSNRGYSCSKSCAREDY